MSSVYKKIKIDGSGGGGGGGTFEFFFNAGPPVGLFGLDGDVYLDTTNDDLYKKSGGVWTFQTNIQGSTGLTGATGAPGSQIYSAPGAPSGGLGVNTDFYVNETNGDFYLKVAGVWVLQGNLTGPQGPIGFTGATGAPGSVWRNGSGVPSNGLGINGDFYLDDSSGSYYEKIAGVYVLQGSLQYTSLIANIDGGSFSTNYGGTAPINGGTF